MPFAAYEMDGDGNHVRQLNVSFVEDANDGVANLLWDMGWDGADFAPNGGREYIFIHACVYYEHASGPMSDNAL